MYQFLKHVVGALIVVWTNC